MTRLEKRVQDGRDPLSGRPMRIVGTVRWEGNRLVDDTGREVTLSPFGDWVYA
jgi:hypothetical protein